MSKSKYPRCEVANLKPTTARTTYGYYPDARSTSDMLFASEVEMMLERRERDKQPPDTFERCEHGVVLAGYCEKCGDASLPKPKPQATDDYPLQKSKAVMEDTFAMIKKNEKQARPFFSAEDFHARYPHLLTVVQAAAVANAKLEREGVRVYGCIPPGETEFAWAATKVSKDTHSALLIGITPLVRENQERALLRELVDCVERGFGGSELAIVERARKLLERE